MVKELALSRLIRSQVIPGSVKKAERVLRRVRPLLSSRMGYGKILAMIRLANDRRAYFLGMFLTNLYKQVPQVPSELYVEKKAYLKRVRPGSKGMRKLIRRPRIRFVAYFKQ